MKNKFSTTILIISALVFGMILGASVYEHMFGIPKMLQSQASLIQILEHNTNPAPTFWIPLHGILLVSLIAGLVLNWKVPERKTRLLYVLGIYLFVSTISIFFAKELFALPKISDSREFEQRTSLWLSLSWCRPILFFFSQIALLTALTKTSSKHIQ